MTSDQARLVTVSASYGAGGSVVAPALARRLGVPFLQRVTTTSGGTLSPEAGPPEPCTERLAADEADLTPAHRLLAALTQAMPAGPTQSPPSSRHQEEHLRRHCEEGIRRLAADEAGVILGRGAAVALGKERGFHVRLDGPPALRVAQGASIEGVVADEARKHMAAADRARTAYVRRLYRADPADPRHYHLVIDSTAIPLDAVTEVILRALSSFPAALFAPVATPPALLGWRRVRELRRQASASASWNRRGAARQRVSGTRMSVPRGRMPRQRIAGGAAAPRRGQTEPRLGAGGWKCMRVGE